MTLLSVCICLVCLTAVCLGETVLQSPDLINNQDKPAVITCAHNIPNYERILWYKKDIMGFKLMGVFNLAYGNPELEFKDKITLSGDGRNNVTLTIKKLALTDSAVYFCAAYYTVFTITSHSYTNLPEAFPPNSHNNN
ncbi:hypothetical protein R3I94_011585 [Phoxinus phoxinus]